MKITKPKFTWKTIRVAISKIKPTPNNFKLKTEDGLARFNKSVEKYGRAGAVIINADYTLINGNTNVEKAKELGEKFIDASIPNKKLSSKEFTEFAAMFDFARAGEVDLLRIKEELGTTDSFFKNWGMELPSVALSKLAELEANEKVVNPTGARKIPDNVKEVPLKPITLMLTADESTEYIKTGESLYKQYKVDNITDLSFKLMKQAGKQRK